MDALTGRTQRTQLRLAQEAQARQASALAESERKVARVEGGQRTNAQGGRGMLAYIDRRMRGQRQGLASRLGGDTMALES